MLITKFCHNRFFVINDYPCSLLNSEEFSPFYFQMIYIYPYLHHIMIQDTVCLRCNLMACYGSPKVLSELHVILVK